MRLCLHLSWLDRADGLRCPCDEPDPTPEEAA
jgi:hypothetical protein